MGKKCDLYPTVNGEDSQLYKELSRLVNSRPLVNYIYAAYLQEEVAAEMDARGKKRNAQNQHTAKDVYEFFDVSKMINETLDIYTAKLNLGAIDNTGEVINYTSAKEALSKAQQFNETSSGLVASVIQKDDKFNIIVEEKDSRTQIQAAKVIEQQKIWQILEQAFNRVGLDINTISTNATVRDIINPINSTAVASYLKTLKNTRNDILTLRDITTLLLLNQSDSKVQRLITKFGSLEEAAQKSYDSFRSASSVTSGEKVLIISAINSCKEFNNLDLASLDTQIQQSILALKNNSVEEDIQFTLTLLDRKYGISRNEIHLIGDKIKTLSQAATRAAFVLQRQINKNIAQQQSITEKDKRLEAALDRLLSEIKNKRYYAGCLNFLAEANNQVQYIQSLLTNLPTTGTNREVYIARSKVIMEIKDIYDDYFPILKAISDLDSIVADDERLNSTDKQVLKDTANSISEQFKKLESPLEDLKNANMLNIIKDILGDKAFDEDREVAVGELLTLLSHDSSYFDHFYSVGRVSNPLIGAMGGIIRDAQGERDKKMNEISLRIRRANDALRKAGFTSSFMYDKDGYIISDINWEKYNKAKKAAKVTLINQGLRGLELKEALNNWIENNTVERIVDYTNGRIEKVPNELYRVEFPTLAPAQQQYYETMMQIKGELGSLLPEYAQNQYLPPQIRRDFLDAVNENPSPKNIIKAAGTKIANIWKIREDDTDFINNAIIGGEEYQIVEGAAGNTLAKNIPLFYINKLKDQKELLKDFSGSLQHFAATAINYDAMYQVKDLVEFMGDYISGIPISENNGKFKVIEAITTKSIALFKNVHKQAKTTRTAAIIEGFLDKHLYGINIKDSGKWVQFAKSVLGYTSIKNLAVNVKGAISNWLVGEFQMLLEAGAREFYGLEDYLWAHTKLFGDATVRAPGKIIDFFTNNRNSYDTLLTDIFEPIPGNFEELGHKRYYHSPIRQLISHDFMLFGYATGEYALHYTTMYAILHNTKVLLNGKKIALYNAFTKSDKEDGNSELVLKDGVTDLDGNSIDQDYLDNIKKRIRFANQTTHGAMNKEDKGLIHQRMLGRFVMNFRQWMVETYSKRFRGKHYDATIKDWREGYYSTVGKLLIGYLQELNMFKSKAALHWSTMTDIEKSNVRRFLTEQSLLGALTVLSFALGEPEDHKKEFWYRMFIYQTKRLKLDLEAGTPIGAIINGKTILNSPIAAVNTINGWIYPFFGLEDINDTIQSGPYKGWNKYFRNVLKYTVPFYNQIDQLMRMDEDESVFSIFDNSNKYR